MLRDAYKLSATEQLYEDFISEFNKNMNDFAHFSKDDILLCPDSVKVKILLTVLRKQNEYIQTLEKNNTVLTEAGKQCSERLKKLESVHRENTDITMENNILRDVLLKTKEKYKEKKRILREKIRAYKKQIAGLNQNGTPVSAADINGEIRYEAESKELYTIQKKELKKMRSLVENLSKEQHQAAIEKLVILNKTLSDRLELALSTPDQKKISQLSAEIKRLKTENAKLLRELSLNSLTSSIIKGQLYLTNKDTVPQKAKQSKTQ